MRGDTHYTRAADNKPTRRQWHIFVGRTSVVDGATQIHSVEHVEPSSTRRVRVLFHLARVRETKRRELRGRFVFAARRNADGTPDLSSIIRR